MITINGNKMMKKGVRGADGSYHPVRYSHSSLINGKIAVTVYAKTYNSLPASLNAENNTEMAVDYFEKDRVRFYKGTNEYEMLLQYCNPKPEVK